MDTSKIEVRYSGLAEEQCCLSCGGAINYSEVQSGENCVDLGSGRGTDAIRMAQKTGPSGYVYGIDVSDGMIAKAKKNAKKLKIDNIEFLKSDLETLPVGEKSINLVISNCTINHAKDKNKVWSEVHRILKPGGRFVVSDIYSSEDVPEEYKNDPEAVAECWAGAVTKDVYLKTLKETGFVDVQIIEESAPYDKGKIQVASFTILGFRKNACCSK